MREKKTLLILFLSLLSYFIIPIHPAFSEGVAHRQEWVHVQETGRSIPVEVFIPLSSLQDRKDTPQEAAQFTFYVPRPDMPGGLWNLMAAFNFQFDGVDLESVIGGDIVVEAGDFTKKLHPGRAIVFLPGGNSPGFPYFPAAVELARQSGFVVFLPTLPFAAGNFDGLCLRQSDAEAVVDFIEAHPHYGRLTLHGMGHSIGGQIWIARMSDEQTCGFEQETRVKDLVLLDGTWESTSLAQTSNLHTPTLIFSQQCRFSQMLLQIEVPSNPVRIDLEGFLVNPFNGAPIPLGSGLSFNHSSLFGQSCIMNEAIVAAGGPTAPGQAGQVCQFPETVEIERRSADVVRKYSEEFIKQHLKGIHKHGAQPGEPYAHIIPDPPPQEGEEGQFSNYCMNVLGNDPDEFVEIDFTLQQITIPRQF